MLKLLLSLYLEQELISDEKFHKGFAGDRNRKYRHANFQAIISYLIPLS